jgi:ubiquinone/menaquinone biosynthesis C-methylase UbiE
VATGVSYRSSLTASPSRIFLSSPLVERAIERNTKETNMNAAQGAKNGGEHQATEDQAALWNGVAGRTWVEAQELLDRMLEPFEKLLVEEVVAGGKRSVLDVGCGTGATTLAIARSLGASGRSVGVDISEPMIALARQRAADERVPATFIVADAQTHAFEANGFDMLVSRFGVMFFEDSVRAFANLRRAARAGADVRLIAWRGPADNPFMTAAEHAAAPLLPCIPPRRAEGPGQFAFADAKRVRGMLAESGWAGIDIRPLDVACAFPADQLEEYLTRLGPVGRILHEADEQTRSRVAAAVRAAFDPYIDGDAVRFNGACWLICARLQAA